VSVRLSVCLSHRSTAAAACGGFAAERPAGSRYRSIATDMRCTSRVARAVLQAPARSSNGAAARRSAANAGSVTLTADGGG